MDDLKKMLDDILSTDEGKKGFEKAMQFLNGSSNPGDTEHTDNHQNKNDDSDGFNFDPKMLLQLKSLFSSVPKNDKNTAFLKALKPLLKPHRQQKADEAIKMMKLFSLLPALTQSGLLKSLF